MEKLKVFYAAICTAVTYVFGGRDTMFTILLIFMAIDFISGFSKARALKEFDSSKFYIGGVKKFGILLIVAIATQLDKIISIDSMAIRTVAISYYIANEGFSVLENWGAMNLPLPAVVKDALIKLKKENEKNDKK